MLADDTLRKQIDEYDFFTDGEAVDTRFGYYSPAYALALLKSLQKYSLCSVLRDFETFNRYHPVDPVTRLCQHIAYKRYSDVSYGGEILRAKDMRHNYSMLDRLIEAELPKFIRAIVQGLRTEKDIIKLLETYQTIAGEGLRYDIEVLIMDLKSGNFEEGMTEFEKRLGNSYVSRLAKALIAVNRGDDQSSMLNYLLSDMGLLAKEMMQRELNKRPGRVKMLVIPIVLVAVVALFYVIGANLFSSLGGIM